MEVPFLLRFIQQYYCLISSILTFICHKKHSIFIAINKLVSSQNIHKLLNGISSNMSLAAVSVLCVLDLDILYALPISKQVGLGQELERPFYQRPP